MTDPSDRDLFHAAIGKVTPLAADNRVSLTPPVKYFNPSPTSAPALPDTLSDFCSGDAPDEYLANGCARLTLRKARRSLLPQGRLDLHGYLSDAARRRLQQFLHDAYHQGWRCVLIIHGKGMNSPNGDPVLKRLTRHWLMQHPAVLAYCDAPLTEGGHGAVWVLLRGKLGG